MKTKLLRWYLFPSALTFLILMAMAMGQAVNRQAPNSSPVVPDESRPKPQSDAAGGRPTYLPVPFNLTIAGDSEASASPSYYLSLYEVQDVQVKENPSETVDSSSKQPSDKNDEDINYDINRDQLNANSVMLTMPVDKSYTVTFRPKGDLAVKVELVKGVGNRSPVEAIRYRDLILPRGATATITIGPQGAEPLRVKSSEGAAETIVTPTVSLEGEAARDIEGPEISFSESQRAGETTITIAATDPSGISSLLYSTDPYSESGMRFLLYTSGINVNPQKTPVVYAIAEDNAGNRSGLAEYRLKAASR